MTFGPIFVKNRNGQEIELRNAVPSDAAVLTDYLRITAGETPFLIREPDEGIPSDTEEREFLQRRLDAERELLLLAFVNGQHAGNCALMQVGAYKRYAHRCEIAIALYQAYCGMGIGRIMLEAVLETAKETGYEQAELEVMADNRNALALYRSLGFQSCGTVPHCVKYSDGIYGEAFRMIRYL